MIFNCPSCSAGHSVPVSMIPAGGLDMTCRRCSSSFHVDMPERTHAGPISIPPEEPDPLDGDETPATSTVEPTAVGIVEPPMPQNVEPTRLGVVTPFLEPEEPKPQSLLSPSGQLYAPTARFDAPPPAKPRPKTPITHGRAVPPSEAEMGLDPELDDTQRVSAEEAAKMLPQQPLPKLETPTNVGRDAKTHVGDLATGSGPPSAEREVSLGAGPNGLYERVAAGVYVPEEARVSSGNSSGRVRVKAWDEPSAYVEPRDPMQRFAAGARRAAIVLNDAPLALKVALVVFPLTLGLALMLTSGRDPLTKQPVQIEIPVQKTSAQVAAVAGEKEAAPAEEEAEPTPKATHRPVPKPRKVEMPGDAPAPEGYAYVQMDRARLRAEPSELGDPTARLDLGQLVRAFERVDGYVLVMAEPRGPAGFVSERLIGAMKPIALLAKEIAFAACEVTEEYTIDDCLYQGKQQHDACIEACGVAVGGGEDSPTVRCAEACKVAFNECQRSCNGEDRGNGGKRKIAAKRKGR